jgi:ribose transport system substrate-binding protein
MRWRGLVARASVACAVGGVALLAAACGSEKSGSQARPAGPSRVAEAEHIIDRTRAPLTFTAPGAAVDVAKARGKRVWFVNNTEQVPILSQWRKTIQAELERHGVRMQLFDGKSDPNEWARGIKQGIAAGADLIVVQALPTNLIVRPLEQARQAGIPVVSTTAAPVPGPPSAPGITAEATYDYRVPGRLLGAWFVADSKGKGDAETKAMVAEVGRLCPRCHMRVEDAPPEGWFNGDLQTKTKTLLQAHPDVSYLLPVFSGMFLGISPALKELGLDDRIRVGSFNAEVPQMKLLRAGSALKMLLGVPNDWVAAAAADTILRVLVGVAQIADHKIPFRVFDARDLGAIDVSKERSRDWYGDDFIARYRKLWTG